LPIWQVVSDWPKPSRMRMPQARSTCSMTSGLSGSPAPTSSRSGGCQAARSSLIIMRQTVGGAHSEVTPQRTMVSRQARAEKRS
jgi:hypothetical protein